MRWLLMLCLATASCGSETMLESDGAVTETPDAGAPIWCGYDRCSGPNTDRGPIEQCPAGYVCTHCGVCEK